MRPHHILLAATLATACSAGSDLSGAGAAQKNDAPPAATASGSATGSASASASGSQEAATVAPANAPVDVAGAFLVCDRAPDEPAGADDASIGCGYLDAQKNRAAAQPAIKAVRLMFSDGAGDLTPALAAAPATSRWQVTLPVPLARAAALTQLAVTADGAKDGAPVTVAFAPTLPDGLPVVSIASMPLAEFNAAAAKSGVAPATAFTCEGLRASRNLFLAHAACSRYCGISDPVKGGTGRFYACEKAEGVDTASCACFKGERDKAYLRQPYALPFRDTTDAKAVPINGCAEVQGGGAKADDPAPGLFLAQSYCARGAYCRDTLAGPKGAVGMFNECQADRGIECQCLKGTEGFTITSFRASTSAAAAVGVTAPARCDVLPYGGDVYVRERACQALCQKHAFATGWPSECRNEGSDDTTFFCNCIKSARPE